jgi:uncharacterized repeat protein (TIGR04138 family)
MTLYHAGLAEVARRDGRYAYEAYEFIFQALHHTQKALGKEPPESLRDHGTVEPHYHVSGPELMHGVRDLALREFGRMARTVFRLWGIHNTGDFGEIVFTLIEAGLMSKTDEDRLEDFRDVYDLDAALIQGYQIQLDEAK